MDVGKLRPVEVILILRNGDNVIIATDTDDIGIGNDAMAALEDMCRTSPAVIYLDTAEYLLMGPKAEGEMEKIRRELKDSVKLCRMAGQIDLKQAAQYLNAHGDLPCLKRWESGTKLPIITTVNNRTKILENYENDT